jgi:hypothetical protein
VVKCWNLFSNAQSTLSHDSNSYSEEKPNNDASTITAREDELDAHNFLYANGEIDGSQVLLNGLDQREKNLDHSRTNESSTSHTSVTGRTSSKKGDRQDVMTKCLSEDVGTQTEALTHTDQSVQTEAAEIFPTDMIRGPSSKPTAMPSHAGDQYAHCSAKTPITTSVTFQASVSEIAALHSKCSGLSLPQVSNRPALQLQDSMLKELVDRDDQKEEPISGSATSRMLSWGGELGEDTVLSITMTVAVQQQQTLQYPSSRGTSNVLTAASSILRMTWVRMFGSFGI